VLDTIHEERSMISNIHQRKHNLDMCYDNHDGLLHKMFYDMMHHCIHNVLRHDGVLHTMFYDMMHYCTQLSKAESKRKEVDDIQDKLDNIMKK